MPINLLTSNCVEESPPHNLKILSTYFESPQLILHRSPQINFSVTSMSVACYILPFIFSLVCTAVFKISLRGTGEMAQG